MAEKKSRTIGKENTVRLVGYIKEDNLEVITNNRGDQVIRGNLIITTDDKGISSHKVQFYVSETTKSGEHSKDYDSLSELLPEKVVSVASFLDQNAGATFEDAANASSKIWVIARLEEYARRTGEREDSMITIKGFRAGLKKATDKTPFAPVAEFSIDVYVNALSPEVTVDEDNVSSETGRLNLEGVFLDYKNLAHKIQFVAPVEDGIAGYIKDHYKVGTTVNLKGDLVSLMEREIDESASNDHFGRGNAPQYKTTFIRERKILGGSKTALEEGAEGAYSKKAITDGLASREILMDENGKKKAARDAANAAIAEQSAAETKGFTDAQPATKSFASDLDF